MASDGVGYAVGRRNETTQRGRQRGQLGRAESGAVVNRDAGELEVARRQHQALVSRIPLATTSALTE